ncbi:hypothetical protein [Thermoplasma volcanium GSS1]|uniref:D-aminoacyl-tRNA deacylase n=1 Tax=Thermoplasma volcanium (strain ATCC 51530 / DSM 4299 / JCM 9571 / NBRC 15438 / GSS1) TaxID=273116 RepID=DTDA_THEVO|nr:D-aminoacyl-tRNA deacylase [Thermoplasma volcanium]Q97CM5.1 RecName: Full=D-aminoacyl-tRNA deacylase; AltName: Full=D-tyrosyl-tRNA(Tyr) deacylase [Thermoplasma volcanium GSS1]BAB59218.1 hypothetical protein [Thermoplasma volcanium GSS1]
MKVLIASKSDPASMQMLSYLEDNYDIKENSGRRFVKDFEIFVIEDRHIFHDMNLGNNYEYAVVLSRHSSAADIKSLTAHPTGNFGPKADLGGRPKTINVSCPKYMSGTLRQMLESYSGTKFQVTFEATHHGPIFDLPNYYVEIGTTENEWTDDDAKKTAVDAVINPDAKDFPNFVAVGGGHYAPKILEYFRRNEINIGHIISKHDHDDLEEWQIKDAVEKTPSCKGFLVDRKGTRSRVRDMVKSISDDLGLELIMI